MEVYYLHHSGVAVKLDGALLVFDYWKHREDGNLSEGYIHEDELKAASRVYVFVSHVHEDHFNPVVFEWAKTRPVTYILDEGIPDAPEGAVRLARGEEFRDDFLNVRAFGSTDIGVSFFVHCAGAYGGVGLFHAGDLNCWHWQDDGDAHYAQVMRAWFDRELRFLKHCAPRIDYAFFPLDKRMGSGYEEGPDKFIEAMKPGVLVPIHFVDFGDTQDYAARRQDGETRVLPVFMPGRLI